MTSHLIEILIRAKDEASNVVGGVGKSTQALGTQLQSISKEATGASLSFGSIVSSIGSIASTLGLGLAIQHAAQFSWEMAQAGASAERVQASFQSLADQKIDTGAVDLLEKLRSASRGSISDTDLMLSANKAIMLQVTTSADEMARLLEVAAARGRAMGRSTAEAFQDIVTGIGRISPLILDNLGILTGGEKGFSDYAESIGKTREELTDLEKRQYLVQKVLADDTILANDAAGGFESLSAATQNLREIIG